MTKVTGIEAVLERIHDGAVIMIGGFMAVGTPEDLVDGLVTRGLKNLTIIGNDTGLVDRGIGKLVVNRQVKKVIASHIGMNPETGRQMNAGEIEVELIPQGTLAERIRAGGAGLGGILTPTGMGTIVEEGKRKIEVERPGIPARTAAPRGRGLAQGVSGRYRGQPGLSLRLPKFQPSHGHRRRLRRGRDRTPGHNRGRSIPTMS